ncbi:hypothetical protein TUBRATIS_10870 [Tubulinosema ratisbonensis]|uniref:Uncharacterized protein n=1 Tax=Tubulinosema ratisbonensis TaxID=291195 RepID=A0A437AMI2_9MICR|nr:hypothetical protein TUBRATIS_10870 [Tubulinosema ratisbonensis]
MIFLHEMKENKMVYTFGKVTKILDKNTYIITYNDTSLELFSDKPLKVDEWIKFYGMYKDNIFIPKFIINITGCDINLLVKSIFYLRNE